MRSTAVILVLCAIALGSCAQRATEPATSAVLMAPRLAIDLPPPSALGRSVETTQLVTARYGKDTFVFEGHVSATPERFLMVGLDALGRKAMTITWTDGALSYELAPWFPGQLRPENVLADMVLMYWPDDIVRQSLSASSATLLSDPRRRSVMQDGKEVIRVEYAPAPNGSRWSGSQHYRHLVWNYQLDVQSAEQQP